MQQSKLKAQVSDDERDESKLEVEVSVLSEWWSSLWQQQSLDLDFFVPFFGPDFLQQLFYNLLLFIVWLTLLNYQQPIDNPKPNLNLTQI